MRSCALSFDLPFGLFNEVSNHSMDRISLHHRFHVRLSLLLGCSKSCFFFYDTCFGNTDWTDEHISVTNSSTCVRYDTLANLVLNLSSYRHGFP
jgi:hypothetical protein